MKYDSFLPCNPYDPLASPVWIFSANPRPDALMKEQLTEMTGLSQRVVRVWFQNKRCKEKKRLREVSKVGAAPAWWPHDIELEYHTLAACCLHLL